MCTASTSTMNNVEEAMVVAEVCKEHILKIFNFTS